MDLLAVEHIKALPWEKECVLLDILHCVEVAYQRVTPGHHVQLAMYLILTWPWHLELDLSLHLENHSSSLLLHNLPLYAPLEIPRVYQPLQCQFLQAKQLLSLKVETYIS